MVEKILGKDQARSIYVSAFISGLLTEKQAESVLDRMEKKSWDWQKVLSGIFNTATDTTKKTLESIIPTIGWTAAIGGGVGVLGATAYDALKERLTNEDPETKFNNDIEVMYENKKREIDDARWMDRVRAMRDDLRRNYKKMTPKEYAKKYDELVEALNERA